MKKHKSISNWMNSALSKPPPSALSKHQSSKPQHTAQSSSSLKSRSKVDKSANGDLKSLPLKMTVQRKTVAKPRDVKVAPVLCEDSDVPWTDKHTPESIAELAVHKKKIAEVQQWLAFALSPTASHPMLLLTGPPGCGKTATVRTLAREMGCAILEWINPVTDVGGGEAEVRPGDLMVYAESQTKQFHSFLVRANRYPSLQVGGVSGCGLQPDKKIVIVEDFPNAFLRDANKFHDVLRSVSPSLRYPLVFIVSESHRRASSTHTLFSKSVQNALDIHTISFNPVAHTALVKTLLRIATSECSSGANKSNRGSQDVKFHLPPREVIEQLAESSAGDIRSAINALQVTCLADSSVGRVATCVRGQRSTRLKRSRSDSLSGTGLKRHASFSDGGALAAIGGRDNSLFLFRALGKILYCKRDTAEGMDGEEGEEGERGHVTRGPLCLPPHLQEHERGRLLVDPELVLEHSHLSSDMFVLYLHQNYLFMHNHVDDVVRASEYLSASDVVSRPWTDSQTTRSSLQTASSSLACRGLMHSHNPVHAPAAGGGNKWRPLHKPQWISVNRKCIDNCRTARRLFLHLGQSPHAHLWTPMELQTEILPHMALTNTPVRNPDQAALMQSITHFSHGFSRVHVENLGERDVETVFTQDHGGCSVDDDTATGHSGVSIPSQDSGGSIFHTVSQDVGMGPVDSPEDIEDFDDDMIW